MAKKVTNQIGEKERTFIYFVRSGEFIKIGRSKRWKKRIESMQTGSPHTIITLLVLVAEPKLESKLHNWFRTDHFRGEWFHSGPAILAYIKEHLPDLPFPMTDAPQPNQRLGRATPGSIPSC